MSLHGKCHTWWDVEGTSHLCGKDADHQHMHICVCGEVLLMGTSSLSDEQRWYRQPDCPECLARSGRPCVARRDGASDLVMTGVHAGRARAAGAWVDQGDTT